MYSCVTTVPRLADSLGALATKAGLAQLVEQLIYTEKVGGSSPSSRTSTRRLARCRHVVVYKFRNSYIRGWYTYYILISYTHYDFK